MMGYGSDSLETSLRLPSDLAHRWLPRLKNTMAPLRVQSHSNKAESISASPTQQLQGELEPFNSSDAGTTHANHFLHRVTCATI
ncbi:hypothetical protein PS15m_006437 [Mucor circinelloides]